MAIFSRSGNNTDFSAQISWINHWQGIFIAHEVNEEYREKSASIMGASFIEKVKLWIPLDFLYNDV